MNRFFLVSVLMVFVISPIWSIAPKFEWPIGFSTGGGVSYEYSQQENTGAVNTVILNKWKNNTLGFSVFLDLTFFMVRTDLRFGIGGEWNGQKFSYSSYGISGYIKFPHIFRERKVWLYFPMIGMEYSFAFGNNFSYANSRHLYNDLFIMFGLSGDFEISKENLFLKPSFVAGFNLLTHVPNTRTGAGWKISLGVEVSWRFIIFNKLKQ